MPSIGLVMARPNRLFDTDAQGRPPLRGSSSLVAGQLRRYVAASGEAS